MSGQLAVRAGDKAAVMRLHILGSRLLQFSASLFPFAMLLKGALNSALATMQTQKA
jgi:hypothetical protein